MKKLLLLIIVLLALKPNEGKAQIGLAYYPFQSVIALNSDCEKILWADLRMETNTFISNINLELNANYNFKKSDWVNYYTGIGINLNPFYALEDLPATNGYLLHFGTRIKPFQKMKNIQIAFEISPYFNPDFDGGQIRSQLGLAYNF